MYHRKTIKETNLEQLKKIKTGKVRDIYEIDNDQWLIVTTDRISAFDVVFNEAIPEKGKVLNQISNHWFSKIDHIDNHIISMHPERELEFLSDYPEIASRSVIVSKVERLPFECVVRGYLFGSVFNEYKEKKTAGGHALPEGLELASKLDKPIFTPSTKEEEGHDQNIDIDTFMKEAGEKLGRKIMDISIEIYEYARDQMAKYGIILADTKFEFGIDSNGNLILIDEVLTPDSSRYWDQNLYEPGKSPVSFDKQFVRDYLGTVEWNKQPPAPELPEDIVLKTHEKYLQILDIIMKL